MQHASRFIAFLLPRLAFFVVIACCCSGCMTGSVFFNYGRIKEKMEAERILRTEAGVIAIKVKTSCYRTTIFKDEEKPLPEYLPQEAYLVVKPEHIMDYIKITSPTEEGAYPIRDVIVPYHVSVVTPGEFTPATTPAPPAPAPLALADARTYSLQDPIPFKYNGKDVYITFKDFEVKSEREKVRWWVYPLVPPLLAGDAVVTAGAVVVTVPVAIADAVLFIPRKVIEAKGFG